MQGKTISKTLILFELYTSALNESPAIQYTSLYIVLYYTAADLEFGRTAMCGILYLRAFITLYFARPSLPRYDNRSMDCDNSLVMIYREKRK